jgi:flagellar hook-length control protein FliK
VAEGKQIFAPTRVEPQSVYQQVGERVLWLIRNQEEKIRIFLDPPELGHLSLEIHRTKENIQATLYTDNPATKATLESSQLEIQKIVESEGFKLEKFDVLVQQDLGRQERREAHVPPDSRNSSASGMVEGAGSTLPDSFPRTPLQKHSGSRTLDLFV